MSPSDESCSFCGDGIDRERRYGALADIGTDDELQSTDEQPTDHYKLCGSCLRNGLSYLKSLNSD